MLEIVSQKLLKVSLKTKGLAKRANKPDGREIKQSKRLILLNQLTKTKTTPILSHIL